MELKLVRGPAADIVAADKGGRVLCRVGERRVQLHRELSSAAQAGDDVLIGGELRDDVVHAVALKNFTRRKTYKVDFTFHILGAGLGGFLTMVGMFFSGDAATGMFFTDHAASLFLQAVGVAIIVVALRRVLRINQVTRWVESVDA